jgi:hypothetical protein
MVINVTFCSRVVEMRQRLCKDNLVFADAQ